MKRLARFVIPLPCTLAVQGVAFALACSSETDPTAGSDPGVGNAAGSAASSQVMGDPDLPTAGAPGAAGSSTAGPQSPEANAGGSSSLGTESPNHDSTLDNDDSEPDPVPDPAADASGGAGQDDDGMEQPMMNASPDDAAEAPSEDDSQAEPEPIGGPLTRDQLSVPFMLGADISFVQEEEDKGTTFSDNGTQKDILQLLKDHGFNTIRLRLFHSPGEPGGYQYEFGTRAQPYCDEAHTIEMAQRVKSAGMGLLLDFHYSDTWADPDDQHKPAAWEGLSFDDLVTAMHDYTRDTLLAFQAANALPDMVQVGNEITAGMLHPDGHTYEPNNWDQLAELLTAGLSAIEEVDDGIISMLHIDRGGDNDTSVWWVEEALERGVQFDVLGQSAYTAYHGAPADFEANLQDLAQRFPQLAFVIAEYNGEKRAVNDLVWNLPDGRGLGTFFWEPTASGEWGDALFTWSGSGAEARGSDFQIYDQIADDYDLR